jgi:C1A family cysteine protease
MKKKILCLFIIGLLIVTLLPTSSSYNINQSFLNKEKKVEKNEILLFNKYPVMEGPITYPDPKYESPKPDPINTPNYFTWTNNNGKEWTTIAKHQGPCGSCWDFAAIGVFESIIKIRENADLLNPDLSEQYVLSCIDGAGSCYGGSSFEAVRLIMEETSQGNNRNGVPFESCFNYQADHDVPCSDKCENWEENLVPISDYGFYYTDGDADDREIIKTEIYQNGPVVTHMRATDAFKIWGSLNHNPDSYYPYFKPALGINHVIMIVGWKDDSSIPKGGYWICKNSWGTEWGYDGFFNIEYNSLNIDTFMIVTIEYDPESFNWAPKPDTGGPYGGLVGEEITFDASNSIGYEGEIIEYLWDFGGGETKIGKTVKHTYTNTGDYQVTLTVEDSKNNIASSATNVWIQNTNQPANEPTISGSNRGTIGAQYKYTFSSTDPEENDVYFNIEWGDDREEEWIGPYNSGEEVVIAHSWNKMSIYTIRAKAKDVYGSESDWTTYTITMSKNRQRTIFNYYQFFRAIIEKYHLL